MTDLRIFPSLPQGLAYAYTCHWCGEPLRFERGRGWVHIEGGTYQMRCDTCGWRGSPYPSPIVCPQCGGQVRDDHCALPVCGGAAGR